MNCLDCNTKMLIIDARIRRKAGYTYRRYECPSCYLRLTTRESIEKGSVVREATSISGTGRWETADS